MRKIVIIDDDEDDIDFLREAIAGIDDTFLCESYTDADEALRILVNGANEPPEFIFIDINMPLLSGDMCLHAIRQVTHLKRSVLIIISTTMELIHINEYKRNGAHFAYKKPTSMQAYYEIIHEIIRN